MLLIICVFSGPLHLLAVHRQLVLVQLLQVLDRLEKIAHMLSMVVIKHLLLRVSIRLANLSFSIKARQSVLQLLVDHHALVVLWDSPADVNLLELGPVFNPDTTAGPDTILEFTYLTFTIIRRSTIVFESMIAKIRTFLLDLIHNLCQGILTFLT